VEKEKIRPSRSSSAASGPVETGGSALEGNGVRCSELDLSADEGETFIVMRQEQGLVTPHALIV
jgi:hypothetical protein